MITIRYKSMIALRLKAAVESKILPTCDPTCGDFIRECKSKHIATCVLSLRKKEISSKTMGAASLAHFKLCFEFLNLIEIF